MPKALLSGSRCTGGVRWGVARAENKFSCLLALSTGRQEEVGEKRGIYEGFIGFKHTCQNYVAMKIG